MHSCVHRPQRHGKKPSKLRALRHLLSVLTGTVHSITSNDLIRMTTLKVRSKASKIKPCVKMILDKLQAAGMLVVDRAFKVAIASELSRDFDSLYRQALQIIFPRYA